MKRYAAILLICTVLTASRKDSRPVHMAGREVHDFALPSADGHTISMAGYHDAKGFIIVFTCNHCPFAKLYTNRLNVLAQKYAPQGVPLIAIDPMDTTVYATESLAQMRSFAANAHYTFPYVQDASQRVARSFNATHTPQAYVVWKENGKWIVRYQGAIDNNGQHPEKATPYVAQAVDALLQHRPVPQEENISMGCAINYRK